MLAETKKHWYNQSQKQKGYLTLMSILVIGSIGLGIVVSVLLLNLGSSRTSFVLEQSGHARANADACAEEALRRLQGDPTYTGSGSVPLDKGTCGYTITNLGGENRRIDATGTVDQVVRKAQILIDALVPTVHITSWQEVAEFI